MPDNPVSFSPGSAADARLRTVDAVDGPVLFTRRPVYVPVAARLPWRIAVACLVLSMFRTNSARLDHLHIIHWALTTPKTRQQLRVWLSGKRPLDAATARVDPALEVTLSIAHAEGLIDIPSAKKIKLSQLGVELVEELRAQPSLLALEKEYLASLAPLTEAGLQRTLGGLAR